MVEKLLLIEVTEANLFGKSRKVQQEMDPAKAAFEKAMDSKEDSKYIKAFKAKSVIRIRSSIDNIDRD